MSEPPPPQPRLSPDVSLPEKRRLLAALTAAMLVCGCGSGPAESKATPPAPPVVYFDQQGKGNFDTFATGAFATAGNWQLAWAYDCSNIKASPGALPQGFLIIAIYRETIAPKALLFDSITPPPETSSSGVAIEDHADATAGPPKGRFFLKVVTDCTWQLRAEPA